MLRLISDVESGLSGAAVAKANLTPGNGPAGLFGVASTIARVRLEISVRAISADRSACARLGVTGMDQSPMAVL